MQAVLWKGYGGYEQLECREDVPVPRPGAADVLVRIGAAGVIAGPIVELDWRKLVLLQALNRNSRGERPVPAGAGS